ncbi:MAG: peptidylprolyl isomerase [Bacteroidetes bacterium]|nr:peptidylprolyl isomerase [Bacteroidota bacterium]
MKYLSPWIWSVALFFASFSPLMSQDIIVDEIAAVVGGHIILESELEIQFQQIKSQNPLKEAPYTLKCKLLEAMLFQKLLLNQAELDSVQVTDAQVDSEMDRRLRYFISQIGSQEKLEEYYQKSITEIKSELRQSIKEQIMEEEIQRKITKDVNVTPSEVRSYFKKIPRDSIPLINSEMEIGVISKIPLITEEEKKETRNRLNQLREKILKGESFNTMAVLYSEDPGSSSQGGELGSTGRGIFHPAFEAVAFRLKPGEISEVVETPDGFHILQLINRKGEYVNVRHILLRPKVSANSLERAQKTLDSIARLIKLDSISFADAVKKISDDPSKNNNGMLVNPATGNSRFETDAMDTKMFYVIDKLQVGEISKPVMVTNDKGREEMRLYYLKSRSKPHRANLDDDYSRISEWAMEKKKDEVVGNWINGKSARTYINIHPRYKDCKYRWSWKLS